MARELQVSVEVLGTTEADAAIARLALAFQKAGDNAIVAAEKAEKFEKSYKDGSARKAAKAELDALSKSTDKVASSASAATGTTDLFGKAIMRIAAPAVMIAAVKSTMDWAGSLTDLSRATGISTTSLQKFESIGKQSGATMDSIARASLQLSNRLAGGDRSASRAMEELGLSTAALINMSPDRAMLEFAAAISKVENPQKRVALAMDALGRSGGELLPTLMDLNAEWDKTTAKLSEDGVKALDDAGDAMDRFMDTGKGVLATVLVPFAPLLEGIFNILSPVSKLFSAFMKDVLSPLDLNKWREWADNLRDAARSMQYIVGLGSGIKAPLPNMPGVAGQGFMPTPLGAIPLPGNMSEIERRLTSRADASIREQLFGGGGRSSAGGAKVLPFKSKTSFLGSAAATIFALKNTPGSFNAGSLPFNSSPGLLESGGSPLDFMNGSMLMGGVPMNAPGAAGGGLGGWLKNNKARVGISLGTMAAGYLGSKIGGKAGGALSGASQGAQMGMMFGPWGAAVGGVIGGVAGWIGAGKAAKNKKNAETSQVYEQFSTDQFIAMQREADRLGVSLEKALKAKNMKDFTAAVEEATGKIKEMTDLEDEIKSLTEAATVDFDKMNAVVNEFGLDVSKLGPAFQQAKIDKEAQRIIDAFAIMEKGGADMNGVLDGMADEIGTLVRDSIQFGTTIPENMKPWVEKLKESGKLVDENGVKITDTSKLKFGTPMESEMDKVVKKLDELIAKLGDLTGKFRDATGAATDLAGIDYNQPPGGYQGNPNPSGNNESGGGFATGGMAGRDFRRPGYGDVFPALLRRGETVLPAGVHRGGVSINGDINVNGGYSSRADAVEEIGEAVVKYMERRGARLVA